MTNFGSGYRIKYLTGVNGLVPGYFFGLHVDESPIEGNQRGRKKELLSSTLRPLCSTLGQILETVEFLIVEAVSVSWTQSGSMAEQC